MGVVTGSLEDDERRGIEAGDDAVRDSAGAGVPRYTRRLPDKVLVAFHHACDSSDLEVADQLLRVLELILSRRSPHPDGNRRRSMETLVAAHERLWHLKHPDEA